MLKWSSSQTCEASLHSISIGCATKSPGKCSRYPKLRSCWNVDRTRFLLDGRQIRRKGARRLGMRLAIFIWSGYTIDSR